MADPALPVVDPANPAKPEGGAAPSADQAQMDAINAAVSAHLKRALGGLPGMIDAALLPIREQLAQRGGTPAKPEGGAAPAAGGGSDVDQLRTQLKALQDQAAGERRASRESGAFQALRAELSGKVRPEALETAAKLVFHADKRVLVGEDGSIVFKLGEADYGLKEGVAAYLKSPDAAIFLAAPSGAPRPGQRVPGRPPGPPGAPPLVETPLAKTVRLLSSAKSAG